MQQLVELFGKSEIEILFSQMPWGFLFKKVLSYPSDTHQVFVRFDFLFIFRPSILRCVMPSATGITGIRPALALPRTGPYSRNNPLLYLRKGPTLKIFRIFGLPRPTGLGISDLEGLHLLLYINSHQNVGPNEN